MIAPLGLCPRGEGVDGCALNRGASQCLACGRRWPPDETWPALYPLPLRAVPVVAYLVPRSLR